MSATDKPLVTAADGKIAPQYYNPSADAYQHVQGSDGAPKMQADDGKIASIGAKADSAVHDPSSAASVIALLKGLLEQLQGGGTGAAPVKLTGSNMQLYGATVANRPAANSVPVGAYYMAVQTQEIWQSDGTNWVVIRGA